MASDGTGPSIQVGYWLSSEEHAPLELVRNAAHAEATGFETAMISDHFHPWIREQGQASFVWSVLGGIAVATERLRVGTGVTAPIIRMHPAVVAHAAATAAVMLPGRFFLGLGTGERLSEHVVAARWPGATERRELLEEAVTIIRALFDGGNVNHAGAHYRVENAQLFTRPVTPPPILLAASGRASAQLAGRVGDGMIAAAVNPRSVEAFEAAGGSGKPRAGQLHVCWAPTVEEAEATVQAKWPQGALKGSALSDLARPKDFEKVVDVIPRDAIVSGIVCGPDPQRHIEAIARFAAAGFTEVYVHQIGPDQDGFFRFYAEHVLPHI
jgi:coenzyme F420-dependent glucose-6-phosphate dehydrogenase